MHISVKSEAIAYLIEEVKHLSDKLREAETRADRYSQCAKELESEIRSLESENERLRRSFDRVVAEREAEIMERYYT